MAALAAFGLPYLGQLGAAKGWAGFGPRSFMGTLGGGGWKKAIMGVASKGGGNLPWEGSKWTPGVPSILDRIKDNPWPWIMGASAVGGATAEEEDELQGQDFYRGPGLDIPGIRKKVAKKKLDPSEFAFMPASYYAAQGGRIGYRDAGGVRMASAVTGGEDRDIAGELWRRLDKQTQSDYGNFENYFKSGDWIEGVIQIDQGWAGAQGGRIGAQEGGLMDLGGMEKDYRQEGGFVPIGGQEKADDVPARLSKNEFVFTADAVRAAGGGDIDAGAEVMENVMENLEQGGQVSEESQGLEGARNMFGTAQRLEGVM